MAETLVERSAGRAHVALEAIGFEIISGVLGRLSDCRLQLLCDFALIFGFAFAFLFGRALDVVQTQKVPTPK